MRFLIITVAFVLVGCATSSVVPFSADTAQVTTRADWVCGGAGAEKVALQQAAVETIKRGFTHFMIIGGSANSNGHVIGYTPRYTTGSATVYGSTAYVSSTTTGGQPIFGEQHRQTFIIRMFREGDPEGAKALSARSILGADWRAIVAESGPKRC